MLRRPMIAALVLAASPAIAQDKAPPDPVQLTVSRQALQIIGQGLMELPYKTAAPVMVDIQNQLTAADKAAADAAKPAEPAKTPEKPSDNPSK